MEEAETGQPTEQGQKGNKTKLGRSIFVPFFLVFYKSISKSQVSIKNVVVVVVADFFLFPRLQKLAFII